MPLKYEQVFDVFQFECDPWDRMTPGAVLRRVQEIGTAQCTSLGLDEPFYQRTHTLFLLSMISLEIFRMPRIEERVRIETRAYGMRRAVYHRVTSLHSADGAKLCETDSRWVLIDTQSRRIMRRPLPEFEAIFSDTPGAEEHDMALPKPGALYPFGERRAGYTLCDRNGHVNNTRYADLMCDHLPMERLRVAAPAKLLLSYRSEIPLNECFTFSGSDVGEDGFYFLAAQDGRKSFEGFVRF